MAISLDKLMGFTHKAVQVRTERMEVLAGNLANANTPGYKARDINFQDAMRSAQSGRSQNLTRTHENHIKGNMQGSGEMQFRISNQPDTGDGNNVDVQVERNAFLDNGLRYQASVEFLNGKIKGMKKAISGGQS
ncbi:flagellar basal body rod protein FlgB [Paraglaciecola chathamensis]|jgi:flagellar basal-body rod protein FlgB|uniref:Flagellar basal body rod protein FlgB n=3 Tax=Paraglaciecola chathamensis TaxID=368405 RepID=A0A8H9M3N7_9ALTE|nr:MULTISPECIES: flagellar basal body rod protein FlgB [Paraglaciecola]AEE22195.1 flagellar basal-body rod protein FlgB [Glaciecola sp. 4H-3-7+YE-5]MBN28030.1 flagellar basal body rod protein FlgB [Alteromonadaceae bacterium]MBJ2135981.1 flagellar basal body rod protein FlgB [Paraglaciecola chathamensis]MBU3019406.1 flagellar basal body rod protein FlgB [Paraglaciecola agarilytica]MDO6558164.1 flagellar basal body rod protein FlgB [Paraglaciecola chathamensis]|tara:strand:+ start:68080 stop:68481 length:402 start_codon:yes stop_codon:yes gene_type:complete